MTDKKKRSLFTLLFLNGTVLLISIIYNLLFKRGLVGKCQFYNTFGLYCPGCGGSRALNALLHFDLLKSFIFYPPIIVTSLIILYADIILSLSLFIKKEVKINPKIFLIIPISIIVNFVLRYILLFFGIDTLGNIL